MRHVQQYFQIIAKACTKFTCFLRPYDPTHIFLAAGVFTRIVGLAGYRNAGEVAIGILCGKKLFRNTSSFAPTVEKSGRDDVTNNTRPIKPQHNKERIVDWCCGNSKELNFFVSIAFIRSKSH